MSILTINNAVKPTLPTKTYCFRGRWDCEDSIHKCPGECGSVTYLDEFGVEQTESGYCIDDGVIKIIASEIIEVIGLNTVVCDQTPIKTLNSQNDLCGSCWDIRINVPAGESRTVVFSSNFQSNANYGISCNQYPNGNIVYQNQSYTITETTDFGFGIDAAMNNRGSNPYSSYVLVEVFNQGNSIASTSYNRSHTNAKC